MFKVQFLLEEEVISNSGNRMWCVMILQRSLRWAHSCARNFPTRKLELLVPKLFKSNFSNLSSLPFASNRSSWLCTSNSSGCSPVYSPFVYRTPLPLQTFDAGLFMATRGPNVRGELEESSKRIRNKINKIYIRNAYEITGSSRNSLKGSPRINYWLGNTRLYAESNTAMDSTLKPHWISRCRSRSCSGSCSRFWTHS